MKQIRLFSLILASGLLVSTTAFGATYKWVDEKGNVHYTQHPPADGNYERMKVDKSPRRSEPPAEATGQSNTPAPAPSTGKSTVLKEEMVKNEETRAQNCEAAKKNLEIYTVYKRYRDKDGNEVRMDDNERLQKIEETKQHIAEFCD